MNKNPKNNPLDNLPVCAAEFIKLVIKKMRYRKKVRTDVTAELAAHFEDEIKDCTTDEEKEKKAQQLIEDFGDARLLAILLRRAKKRCRPLWRTITARTFQTAGILVLCFIFYLIWFISGKPAITVDYVNELNRMVIPVADETLNAAPLFDQAAINAPDMPKIDRSVRHKRFVDVNDTQKLRVTEWVNANSDGLNLIYQGVKKPYFWRQYKTGDGPNDDRSMFGILMPHLAKFRDLSRALCWRAQIHANKVNYSSAFEDVLTCYKFGRLIKEGEKTLLEHLVGISIEALAARTAREILSAYSIDTVTLTRFQQDIEEATANEKFAFNLTIERLTMYDEIQRSFTSGRFGDGHLYIDRLIKSKDLTHYASVKEIMIVGTVEIIISPRKWPDAFEVLFTHPDKAETIKMADDYFDSWEKIAVKSPATLRTEKIDLGTFEGSILRENIFLGIFVPAFGKVHEICYRIKAESEALLTTIALVRYKQDKGSYPTDLSELIEHGYLAKLPIDPFSDKPLVYRKTEDGFTLYSVGFNFKDDGGVPSKDKSGRPTLWFDNGDAVFWPPVK